MSRTRPTHLPALAGLAGLAMLMGADPTQAQTPPMAADVSATSKPTTAQVVRQVAAQIEEQAKLSARTAKTIRATKPAQVDQMLREAEAAGLANAWYARLKLSPAAKGEPVRGAHLNPRAAAAILWNQSRELFTVARKLGVIGQLDPGSSRVETGLAKLKANRAVSIVFGAAGSGAAARAQPGILVGQGPGLILAGATTTDYPSVAALVFTKSGARWVGCTGTLISPRTVLTAAHCVATGDPEMTLSGVFFQAAGLYGVNATAVHPKFLESDVRTYDDVAVIQLDRPVAVIQPALLASGPLAAGQFGRIVGYGQHNELSNSGQAAPQGKVSPTGGLKLAGQMENRGCGGVPNASGPGLICWQYKGVGPASASTCHGDSGGPLFARAGATWTLAGVTAYGAGDLCQPLSYAIDMDVVVYRAWILGQVQAFDPTPAPASPSALNPVENASGFVLQRAYQRLNPAIPFPATFKLAPGGGALRITVNGSELGSPVRLIAAGPQQSQCQDVQDPPLLTCIVQSPTPGDWTVSVDGIANQEIQIAAARN